MSLKSEYLVDLIFKKLKNYKDKEIFLEKESLSEFISSLLKENENNKKNFSNNSSCFFLNFLCKINPKSISLN